MNHDHELWWLSLIRCAEAYWMREVEMDLERHA